jgi:hypothetical protein
MEKNLKMPQLLVAYLQKKTVLKPHHTPAA